MAARHRILLVEDSAVTRTVVRMYLDRDHEVVEAGSAARALQLMRLLDVALVVTDYNLPGADGLELIRALREDRRPQVRDVPVIVLTGERGARGKALEERARQVGAQAVLRKPVAGSGLAAIVASLLPVTA